MNSLRNLLFIFFAAIGLTLAGCGGGGGGTPASTTPTASTLSGTAATGAPLVGATVTVVGANGVTATTTTNVGGTYSVNGTFTYPVLLKATQTAPPITLYSAATAAGTANITPLTNLALMLNAALPNDLTNVENTWVATYAAMLTQANMRAAQAIVNANFSGQMNSAGLTPTTYDFLTTTFTANGTGIDLVMDGLLFTFDNTVGTFAITLPDATTVVSFNPVISTAGITVGELSAPTGVQAVAGNRQVTISWNPVAGATSYNLYMAQQANVQKNPAIMHHSTTATSITPHTDLINGTTWYFMVTALNATGESLASAEVSATPQALVLPVVTLTATPSSIANGATSTLNWSATNSTSCTSTGGGGTGVTGTFTTPALTATTTYTVTCTGTGGGASRSATVIVGSPAAPAAPTGVTATAGNGFVSLSWNASAGATSYKISRQNNGAFTTIATGVVATNYTDNTVTNGTTYGYAVRAVNAAGESLDTNSSGANPTPTSCVALATGLNFQNLGGTSTGFSLSAIVADTDRIYWFDYDASLGNNGGAIRSVPKIGGAITVVASGLGGINAFTVDANNVYWTEYDIASGNGSIKQVPKTGGTPITLATDFFPTGIAVDSTTVFYSGGAGPSGGTKGVPIGGGTVTNISVGTGSFGAASLALDANFIYGVDLSGGGIPTGMARRILKTGGTVEVLATGLENAFGAVLDSGSLYWAEIATPGKIGKTAKTGGGATYLALQGAHNVALDSNFAYFDGGSPGTNPGVPSISKVPLAGGSLVAANESGCNGQYVAVDGTHLFTSVFGNGVAGAGKILRSGK